MKKIFALTLSLGLLLVSGCTPQPQQVNQTSAPQVNTPAAQKSVVQFDNFQRSGNQITVAIAVDQAKDLSGMDGQVRFDSTKLQLLGVDKTDAVKDFLLGNSTENDTVNFALAGGKGIEVNKTDLVVLRFLVLQEGQSELSFQKLELMDSQLQNIPATEQSYTLQGQ